MRLEVQDLVKDTAAGGIVMGHEMATGGKMGMNDQVLMTNVEMTGQSSESQHQAP
jgi:hypothetical protein